MSAYDYKVLPAPRRGHKARGVKSTEDRFALAIELEMNRLGAEGWEYLRADTLPCDERSGLTGRTTTFQSLLVFRRAKPAVTHLVARIADPLIAAPPPIAARAPRSEPDATPAAAETADIGAQAPGDAVTSEVSARKSKAAKAAE